MLSCMLSTVMLLVVGHPLPPEGAGKYPGFSHATTGQASLAGQVPRASTPGKYLASGTCRPTLVVGTMGKRV